MKRVITLCLSAWLAAACEGRTVEIDVPPPQCRNAIEFTCPPTRKLYWHRDNPIPWYNDLLVQAGVTGRVGAELRVAKTGLVDSISIRHATMEAFARPVRDSLTKWRFDPFDTPGEDATPRALPVEILFHGYGCDPESRPKVTVIHLHGTLLLEIVRCRSVTVRVDAGSVSVDSAP